MELYLGHIGPYIAIFDPILGHIGPYMTYLTLYGAIWPYLVPPRRYPSWHLPVHARAVPGVPGGVNVRQTGKPV